MLAAAACVVLLLLLGRLAIGCMRRTTAVSACMCASLNQRSNLLLPTCHQHLFWMDAPEGGPEGAVRGGDLLLELHGQSRGTPQASSQTCPLPLPLPPPAPWADSLCSFSWSLC